VIVVNGSDAVDLCQRSGDADLRAIDRDRSLRSIEIDLRDRSGPRSRSIRFDLAIDHPRSPGSIGTLPRSLGIDLAVELHERSASTSRVTELDLRERSGTS
jgi:hypothetical protein